MIFFEFSMKNATRYFVVSHEHTDIGCFVIIIKLACSLDWYLNGYPCLKEVKVRIHMLNNRIITVRCLYMDMV